MLKAWGELDSTDTTMQSPGDSGESSVPSVAGTKPATVGAGGGAGPWAVQTASHDASSSSEFRRTPFVRPRRAWRGGVRPVESHETCSSHCRTTGAAGNGAGLIMTCRGETRGATRPPAQDCQGRKGAHADDPAARSRPESVSVRIEGEGGSRGWGVGAGPIRARRCLPLRLGFDHFAPSQWRHEG